MWQHAPYIVTAEGHIVIWPDDNLIWYYENNIQDKHKYFVNKIT